MRLFFGILLAIFALLAVSGVTGADEPKRYASIVVDADSLDIIHARQIDELRYPASLTKVMTLYVTFDAINRGELRLEEKLIVSSTAARTPPFGLGLTAGQSITVDQAIQAVAVRSANDVAVVLAERLAGSEENFTHLMNAKAKELGMVKTTFKTASGLPHPEQQTTARDMAKLALAVLNNHRRYYHYFGQTSFTWKGKTKKNTNGLLHWLVGVDGFKTGYTRASGYNLIISAQRDGRRIIAVVLGGASGKSRNQHMQDLVERGFKTLGLAPVASTPPIDVPSPLPPREKSKPVMASAIQLRGSTGEMVTVVSGAENVTLPQSRNNYSVQVGTFAMARQAQAQLQAIGTTGFPELNGAMPVIDPIISGNRELYRARINGLSATHAHAVCKKLSALAAGCRVIAPSG